MSSSDTTGTTLETAVVEAVMLVTGHDLTGRIEGGLRLEDDLGVDSLAAHARVSARSITTIAVPSSVPPVHKENQTPVTMTRASPVEEAGGWLPTTGRR